MGWRGVLTYGSRTVAVSTPVSLSVARRDPAGIPSPVFFVRGEICGELVAPAASASAWVTNTSDRPGSTVAQAYLASAKSAGRQPPLRLKGYEEVALGPGESAIVPLRSASDQLACFDESLNQAVVADGRYKLFVGRSSRDLHDHVSFRLG